MTDTRIDNHGNGRDEAGRGIQAQSGAGRDVPPRRRHNVNMARAQRLEALGEQWEFELDGEVFSLPTELPRDVVRALAGLDPNDLDGLLTLLLGEPQFRRFAQHAASVQDIQALLTAYGRDTGMTLGEASASTRS